MKPKYTNAYLKELIEACKHYHAFTCIHHNEISYRNSYKVQGLYQKESFDDLKIIDITQC